MKKKRCPLKAERDKDEMRPHEDKCYIRIECPDNKRGCAVLHRRIHDLCRGTGYIEDYGLQEPQ